EARLAANDPVTAVTGSGINGAEIAALRPLLAKAGVNSVSAAIAGDFLAEAALKAANYQPFARAQGVRLLYAVLDKARADAGALTHDLVNNGLAADGLASTLKSKFTGA